MIKQSINSASRVRQHLVAIGNYSASIIFTFLISLPLGAAGEQVVCGKDNCAPLFIDKIPTDRSSISTIGRKNISDLSDQDICERLLLPVIAKDKGEYKSWCKAAKIIREIKEHATRTKVFGVEYDEQAVPEALRSELFQPTSRFLPPQIFIDKPRAFLPCADTYDVTEDGNVVPIATASHPFFKENPTYPHLFSCSYELSGWAAGALREEYPMVVATPFGYLNEYPIEKYHRASLLLDSRDILNGEDLLRLILGYAHDPKERARMCKLFGDGCWAPRVIQLKDHSFFDEVVAICRHDLIEGEIFLPSKCSYFAAREKTTNRYYIESLISPETFFPSGDGIGDADISCVGNGKENSLAILNRKYSESMGYRFRNKTPIRIIRKGVVSDVFKNYREIIVLNISWRNGDDKDSFVITPTIYFSEQNVRSQDQYRPISDIEYDKYVQEIIIRLRPELKCKDER